MTNKLLAKQMKAPAKTTKSKPTPATPPPMPLAETNRKQQTIAGLPSERYYSAASALDDLARAAKHQGNNGLMGDVKKVAAHKIKELESVAGRKGKR